MDTQEIILDMADMEDMGVIEDMAGITEGDLILAVMVVMEAMEAMGVMGVLQATEVTTI